MKKFVLALLALCCVLALLPLGIVDAAAAPAEDDVSVFPTMIAGGTEERRNPLYTGTLPETEELTEETVTVPHTSAVANSEYLSEAAATKAVRKYMKARTPEFTVYFKTPLSHRDGVDALYDSIFVHTGVPTEGDYLFWHYGGCRYSWYYSNNADGYTYIEITYTVDYYTNSAQEQEMDVAVAELLDAMDIWNESDYVKVKTIYDYLTTNIRYDYANLEDDSYMLKYSAYAGLVHDTCVCQGYANLFYRLALELDVDARLVAGYGGGPHSWNIVNLNGEYYYLDATWDEGTWGYYDWFLLCPDNFEATHQPWAYEFASYQFPEVYTMATSDYNYPATQPRVAIQPTKVGGQIGDTLTATVKFALEGLQGYQWYVIDPGDTAYTQSSNTTNTYFFKMTEASVGRKGYCVATDVYGNQVKSQVITFTEATPVTIKTQPRGATAASGEIAKVSFTATGDGLTYKWYFANAGEDTFTYTSSFSGNSYYVEMSAARNGRRVYCVVTDQYGNTARTETVKLSMGTTLKITTQPKTAYAQSAAVVSTTVKATGDGLTYQWYIKNADGTTYSKSSVTGPTYSTTMTTKVHGRRVYCVITDKYGSSVQTNTVLLRLSATIKTQPTNASAASGEVVSTSVQGVGYGLKYQWYVCNPGKTEFVKSSNTTKTYSCTMNAANDGRKVYCVITDQFGKSVTSKTVTLSMTSSLKIVTQPKTSYAQSGKIVSVTVKAQGTGLKYQWYVKNADGTTYSKSSVTGPTYSTTMTTKVHGRRVYCVVTDAEGNKVTSNTAMLRLSVSVKTQPTDVTVASGAKASTTVTAIGYGLTYQWYVCDAGSTEFVKSSNTTKTYSCTMNASRDGREIYCVITDQYGKTVKTKTVTLSMK